MSFPEVRRSASANLYAAGLNAHGQLVPKGESVIRTLTPLAAEHEKSDSVDVMYASWSTTVLHSGRRLWSVGCQQLTFNHTPSIHCAFGDHDGLVGILDEHGDLFNAIPSPHDDGEAARANFELMKLTADDSPRLSHIAYAGNERIAVTFKQAPNGRLCHVVEFTNMTHFLKWYSQPANEQYRPDRHHMLPGQPIQLLANMATFLLLMRGGEVYSWGDARYLSLGRPLWGEGATAPGQPGLIDALGGLRINKIASGGWMSAALSEDGALYLWGANAPDSNFKLACLPGLGDVGLVILPHNGNEDVPDIIDIAIGHGHLIVLAAVDGQNNRVFAAGDNGYGQLGIGMADDFHNDWTRVTVSSDVEHNVHRVACGPKATFVLVGINSGCEAMSARFVKDAA